MCDGPEVSVHPLTSDPTALWASIRDTRTVMRLKVRTPKQPPEADKIRVVCMSDTHSLTAHMKLTVPAGDVFIHAGDFTRGGTIKEVREFNRWLGSLPHRHKLVVAGNHELSLDPALSAKAAFMRAVPASPRTCHAGAADGVQVDVTKSTYFSDEFPSSEESPSPSQMRAELTNCVYLEDSATSVLGLNVYGSPWQPEFGGWAFNLPRGKALLDKWNLIPQGTDILITHAPPLGYGDLAASGHRSGCPELLTTVQNRVKPKYHIYGHIHEGYGVRSDGQTVFINASTCDLNYMPVNKPIVFDISAPAAGTPMEF